MAAVDVFEQAIDDLIEEPDWYYDKCTRLEQAIRAGYMLHRGKACIKTAGDIPMQIKDAKQERIIRRILEGAIDE
jgi:hypothetical protein